MTSKPQIAIFADQPAQAAYLAELVAMAGYSAVSGGGEGCMAAIVAGGQDFSGAVTAQMPILMLGDDKAVAALPDAKIAENSLIQKLASPLRAAVVMERLKKSCLNWRHFPTS